MTNAEVVLAWVDGHSAKSKNMSTDGNVLYSYHLPIAIKVNVHTRDGEVMRHNVRAVLLYTAKEDMFVSSTTSRHVSLAAEYARIFILPRMFGRRIYNLDELNDEIYSRFRLSLHQADKREADEADEKSTIDMFVA